MRTESQLIQMIQRAGSLAEQAALVAELDALKASQRTASRRDGEIDLASTMVEASQTPVLVHTMHTAATDWLDDVSMTTEADLRTATNAMAAEASLWFARTSAAVKEDSEEFGEQARGMARRLAGKYGEQAPAAAQAFLDYAAFLHRREAASGLDQVQQITAPDGVTQRRTPLNEEVFDTFNDAVDPMNQGIDEMQTTENAPLLNEIIGEGQGQGQQEVPSGHLDHQVADNPLFAQGSLVDTPSLALGYTMNLDDFRKQAAEGDNSLAALHARLHNSNDDSQRGSHDHGGTDGALNYGRRLVGNGRASDLRSHMESEHGHSVTGSRHPFGREAQVGEPFSAQPHHVSKDDYGTHHGDSSDAIKRVYEQHGLQEEEWGNHHGGEKDVHGDHGPDAPTQKSNNFYNNIHPLSDEPKYDTHHHSGRVVVSTVVDGQVTAASGLPQVGQVMDSQENIAPVPMNPEVAFPVVALPEPQNTQGTGEAMPAPPLPGQGQGPQRQGSRKIAKSGTPDFRKGFGYAANWKAGDPLVKKGSAEFEAGLFTGMRENVEDAQIAWVQAHEMRGGVFARRIALARKFAATNSASELEEMDGGQPSPAFNTPFSGPGTDGPLLGGMDAAAPGGAAPYNGAAPYSAPVTPQPIINTQPAPADAANEGAAQRWAFRQQVQAGLLREKQGA